jgi:biopolymer transport protein ExbD
MGGGSEPARGGGSTVGGLIAPRPPGESAEFDITAMIDLVFMMNIYFLVTFIGAAMEEIDLPSANRARALDAEIATVVTVLSGRDAQSVVVYVGDGKQGSAFTDPLEQEEQIAAAVDAGAARGKTAVLIKAEKGIRLREMKRIAAAASREGVTLHLAVWEKDTSS